jgi:branched-chain amino acid aminotransferase
MFVMAFEKYVKNDSNAHVTFSSWRRIDDNSIPARGKVAGAYANSALIKTDANRAGFDEAFVLDHNGHVSEGSAMNIFMVRDGYWSHRQLLIISLKALPADQSLNWRATSLE